jgi:two-component system KDP operon response regulator KdpE
MIVLSAIGSEKNKIKALDLGADDYLVLPFSMEEFLARVRVVLRRWLRYKSGTVNEDQLILVQDLLINLDSREVILRGERVHLTPKEYDLLTYLAKKMGKVITHRELLKAVWGEIYGGEREYIRVFISQLRRKIEDDPVRPKYILTEPGVGYRFLAG